MTAITFENLPQAVKELHDKIDYLLGARQEKPESDYFMEMDQLLQYLPDHPARQTVYQWIWKRSIPYEKHGKRLYFRKSAIDQWLANGRELTR